jgi:hypothetical protein
MIKVKSEFEVSVNPRSLETMGEEFFKATYDNAVERNSANTAEQLGVTLSGLLGGYQKMYPRHTDKEHHDRYSLTVMATTPEKWNLFCNRLCHAMNKYGVDAENTTRELLRQFSLNELEAHR